MTQKQKDLLLKDLCVRLPYGVEVEYNSINCEVLLIDKYNEELTIRVCPGYSPIVKLENVKSYLYPLSNMTEEQWNNAPRVNLTEFTFESLKCGCFTLASYTCENDLHDLVEFINWLIENHFDIYGLIPMKLAIDATGLNIY